MRKVAPSTFYTYFGRYLHKVQGKYSLMTGTRELLASAAGLPNYPDILTINVV
jgi:hypothetical protein